MERGSLHQEGGCMLWAVFYVVLSFCFSSTLVASYFVAHESHVDVSVTTETRLSRTKQLLAALVECHMRSDREQSTVEACEDLKKAAKKLLRGAKIRDDVISCLTWKSFSKKEKPAGKPAQGRRWSPNNPSMATLMALLSQQQLPQQQNNASSQTPQGGRFMCAVCGRFGHSATTCFTAHPELKTKVGSK